MDRVYFVLLGPDFQFGDRLEGPYVLACHFKNETKLSQVNAVYFTVVSTHEYHSSLQNKTGYCGHPFESS